MLDDETEAEEMIPMKEMHKHLSAKERIHRKEIKELKAKLASNSPVAENPLESIQNTIQGDTMDNQTMNQGQQQSDAPQQMQQSMPDMTPPAAQQMQQQNPASQPQMPSTQQSMQNAQQLAQQQGIDINSLPADQQQSLYQQAEQRLLQAQQQAHAEAQKKEVDAELQRIAKQVQGAMDNDPDFKQLWDSRTATTDPRVFIGLLQYTIGNNDAPELLKKVLESPAILNEYTALDGNIVERTKLLNRVQQQIWSEQNGTEYSNKGNFAVSKSIGGKKSTDQMNATELRAYYKQNGMYN